MKYESNILERLIKTYGVVGNPKYVSEIIKQFIIQGKECYPNLFTYQSDWLSHIDEFGLANDYVVTYTGQRFYAPNTKESSVKRAILKGSTKYRDIDTGEVLDAFEDGRNLELVSVQMPVLTTTGKNLCNRVRGYHSNTGDTQNSWASFDMSCKPNTTYTAKIFSGSNNRFGFFSGVGVVGSTDSYKVTGGNFTPYTGGEKTFTITTGNNDNVMWVYLDNNSIVSLDDVVVQVEESPTATTYEPHKSNILTVNEDIKLGGIGKVKDELDLLTGEVTKRIGEVVFDGSEDWYNTNKETDNYIMFRSSEFSVKFIPPICDRFKTYSTHMPNIKEENGELLNLQTDNSCFQFIIKKEKLSSNNAEGFKQWLSQNPVTVQYQLATDTVKTVDLTIHDKDQQKVERLTSFEGGTHFTTSSQDGSLLPTLTVDVVTDLEETLAVCSLEGNTM